MIAARYLITREALPVLRCIKLESFTSNAVHKTVGNAQNWEALPVVRCTKLEDVHQVQVDFDAINLDTTNLRYNERSFTSQSVRCIEVHLYSFLRESQGCYRPSKYVSRRLLRGCIGREFMPNVSPLPAYSIKSRTSASVTEMLSVKMYQLTCSWQGGVVREPSYCTYARWPSGPVAFGSKCAGLNVVN